MSVDFDIQQPVFSPDGEYLEDAAMHYRDVVMEGFADSAEGQDLVRQGGTIGWADTLMELGMGYLEVTPAAMTAEDMREVLFELFPPQSVGGSGLRTGDRHGVARLLELPAA
jgi:hypothetical protein